MTTDPYLDPGSGVLRNHLGITDQQQLRLVEADLTLAALQDLSTRTLPGGYDLGHLQAFHREIFGDIYPWAGELRTVAIAKTDLFCLPQHIDAIHPFREGNGRAQRAFFRQLSHHARWPIDWTRLEPDQNENASIASLRGDNQLLRDVLDKLVAR